MRLVFGFFIAVPAAQASLTFTAGSGNVTPGGTVTIPITVNTDISDQWISADISLQWDGAVLTFSSASAVSPFTTGSPIFNSTAPGNVSFSWANGSGSTVADGTTIFDLTLIAASDAPLGPQMISFASSPVVGTASSGVFFADSTTSGTVTVIPEPVNYALGGFACVFILSSARRWMFWKRAAG